MSALIPKNEKTQHYSKSENTSQNNRKCVPLHQSTHPHRDERLCAHTPCAVAHCPSRDERDVLAVALWRASGSARHTTALAACTLPDRWLHGLVRPQNAPNAYPRNGRCVPPSTVAHRAHGPLRLPHPRRTSHVAAGRKPHPFHRDACLPTWGSAAGCARRSPATAPRRWRKHHTLGAAVPPRPLFVGRQERHGHRLLGAGAGGTRHARGGLATRCLPAGGARTHHRLAR